MQQYSQRRSTQLKKKKKKKNEVIRKAMAPEKNQEGKKKGIKDICEREKKGKNEEEKKKHGKGQKKMWKGI